MSPVRRRVEWMLGTVAGCIIALIVAYACTCPESWSFESLRKDFLAFRSAYASSPR